MSLVTDFNDYRSKMNNEILNTENKVLKQIFNLDTNAFQDGALDKRTKEMMALACSMVLRCDDCIKYHLEKCHQLGINKNEIFEIFAIANLIGGTIVIPHLRRAVEYCNELSRND